MSESLLGTLLIALMFVLFAMGIEIAIALGAVGVLGLLYLKGFAVGLGVVGSVAWSNATSFSFIAVPLFVFMSGILLHSGVGKGLYTAVALNAEASTNCCEAGSSTTGLWVVLRDISAPCCGRAAPERAARPMRSS